MEMCNYIQPPPCHTDRDEERRIGFEIEVSGVELSMIACQINIVYGGRIEEISPYEFFVHDTELGKFRIELDFAYLKNYAREKQKQPGEPPELEQLASDALDLFARNILPFEVVAPPLPVSQLQKLDALVKLLRQHGAKGTRHLPFYAFGVHINPELPNTDVGTILDYFRAYLCLHDWLAEREKVSFARSVTPFINSFSNDYILKVLASDYQPEQTRFIEDYLRYNPSRNRALDMLPLLTWLDEKQVRAGLPEEKINKRPTLHYRLPNSEIDQPDWRLSSCWNHWIEVERLAAEPRRLESVCSAYHEYLQRYSIFSVDTPPWKEKVTQWLHAPV